MLRQKCTTNTLTHQLSGSGPPAEPTVRAGERVRVGDLVAQPAEGQLGARIHASIDGTVRSVEGSVEIES